MKKASFTGIGKIEIVEGDKPKLQNEHDVLLKIHTVGICGSDMHYYKEGKIGEQIIKFPFTAGHECSATVEEVGEKVTHVKKGDLVAVEPNVACHHCEQCERDRENTCLNQKFLGAPGQLDGGLAEYIVMPESNCFTVPNNFTGEMAALIEPLSIGYYSATFVKKIEHVDSIAILGVGPIGLTVLHALKAMGYKNFYVTDKLDYRLIAANAAGADIVGNPDKEDVVSLFQVQNPQLFDVVVECCGKQEAIDQAVELLKPGGLLLIVGIPEVDRISFDISKARRKEITIQNVRRQNNAVQPSIDFTAEGNWAPDSMITHRFPVERADEAFQIVNDYKDGVIKAMINFQ